MSAISEELRAWLGGAMPGMIASADASARPVSLRVWGAHPVPHTDVVEVFVLRSASAALVEALAVSRRAAMNLIELPSYRSRLFKGTCVATDLPADEGVVEAGLHALSVTLGRVGMPPDAVARMLAHYDEPRSMRVLRLEVESVFDQTPKRGAGERIG